MSIENTLKENCDIKSESMDPQNGSGQADIPFLQDKTKKYKS